MFCDMFVFSELLFIRLSVSSSAQYGLMGCARPEGSVRVTEHIVVFFLPCGERDFGED